VIRKNNNTKLQVFQVTRKREEKFHLTEAR